MLKKSVFYVLLGSNIRRIRKDKNLRLDDLGKATGVDLGKSSVINIEKGRQQLSVYQLVAIAAALGVTTNELLEGISNEQEEINKLKGKSKNIFNNI